MKIGIISDLHCRHSNSEKGTNTNLFSDKLRKPVHQHPVESLIKYIQKENIGVDFLICPGDIADKTDQQGFITGWAFLEELKGYLNAKGLYACLGNHDVDSYAKYSTYNYYDIPKRLKDNFPFVSKDARKSFYTDNFTIIKEDDCAFFVFNSVHSHTNPTAAISSIITDEMLEDIEEELKNLDSNSKFRIGFTHHHPIKHSNVGFKYKDVDVIEKGEKLVELLEKFNFQIFIHGHKHEPRLVRYNTLPILAAGSFSSLENLQETNSRNYFHVVTLFSDKVKGYIENYEFTNILGWDKAGGSKLNYSFGFGANLSLDDFCESIDDYFKKNKFSRINYEEFIQNFEDYNCYIPSEQLKILEILNSKYSIEPIGNKSNPPVEFIKK